MAGISFVLAHKGHLAGLATLPTRNYYLNLYQQFISLEKTGEMRFTPPVQVFYALKQALREFFEEGVAARYERYVKCWETLMQGIERLGLIPLLPANLHSKILTAICEPKIPGFSYSDLHDYLFAKDITIYPGKGGKISNFRIANIGAIDHRDVGLFIQHLEDYLTQLEGKQHDSRNR